MELSVVLLFALITPRHKVLLSKPVTCQGGNCFYDQTPLLFEIIHFIAKPIIRSHIFLLRLGSTLERGSSSSLLHRQIHFLAAEQGLLFLLFLVTDFFCTCNIDYELPCHYARSQLPLILCFSPPYFQLRIEPTKIPFSVEDVQSQCFAL